MTAFTVTARHGRGEGRKGADEVLHSKDYRPRDRRKHRSSGKHEDEGQSNPLKPEHLYGEDGKWVHHKKHPKHRADLSVTLPAVVLYGSLLSIAAQLIRWGLP